MRKRWMRILPEIINNVSDTQLIKCPNCGEKEIEYLYIGDEKTRIGHMQVWCNKCLKGIYVSRVKAPANARFATFDDDITQVIPEYEFDD